MIKHGAFSEGAGMNSKARMVRVEPSGVRKAQAARPSLWHRLCCKLGAHRCRRVEMGSALVFRARYQCTSCGGVWEEWLNE